jgi:hypothetical protein
MTVDSQFHLENFRLFIKLDTCTVGSWLRKYDRSGAVTNLDGPVAANIGVVPPIAVTHQIISTFDIAGMILL